MHDTTELSAILFGYLDQLDHRMSAVAALRREADALSPSASAEVRPVLDAVGDSVRMSDESARVLLRWLQAGRELAAPFRDRSDAGIRLAAALDPAWAGRDDVVVLGIPRGGVPVAFEVARALDLALDVLVVRKLGVPGHEELAFGAVTGGGLRVLNPEVANGLPPAVVADVTTRERREVDRREVDYRGDRPPLDLGGRTVLLVDDGLATGASMRAAVAAVRRMGPAAVVVAVPVGAASTCDRLRSEADDVVCPWTPDPFVAVGVWYGDFSATTDDEVRRLLGGQ